MDNLEEVRAVQNYCKCPSKHSFSRASPNTQQLLREASQWCLDNDEGRQGLALVTSLMPESPYEYDRSDPFNLHGQKLCGGDLELYFGDVFGASNNYVYGMYKTREQTQEDEDCVEILAKIYPISGWQTLQTLQAEYQKAEHAYDIEVGPEVIAVRQCEYKEQRYAIFVMKRWGIGSLTTLVTSGYYAKHETKINRKIKQLLSTLYMSGFTHGDLHSNNILFDEDMNLKLIDFEGSNEITEDMSSDWLYSIEVVGGGWIELRASASMSPVSQPTEDSLWPRHALKVANPRVREFMPKTYDAAGCKEFIRGLTRGQIRNISWKDINSRFNPPCWDMRKALAPDWMDYDPFVCRTHGRYMRVTDDKCHQKAGSGVYCVRDSQTDEYKWLTKREYDLSTFSSPGCVEYYNKCRWYPFINKLLSMDLYQLLEGEEPQEILQPRVDRLAARRCKGIVMAAIAQNAYSRALFYASDELKADREVVMAAVKQDVYGNALMWASAALQADREVVMAAVKQNGDALIPRFASAALKADREVVMAAVAQNGDALVNASDALKADREVVLAAVKQDGEVLQHASDAFKADREVVLAAVKQDGWALNHASEELQADPELKKMHRDAVLETVKEDGEMLEYASAELQADREVVMAAVQQDGRSLEFASEELQNDPEVIAARN